jgi:hypothetical protein
MQIPQQSTLKRTRGNNQDRSLPLEWVDIGQCPQKIAKNSEISWALTTDEPTDPGRTG